MLKEACNERVRLLHNAAASVMHILITLGMEGWAVSRWYIECEHFWFNGYVSAHYRSSYMENQIRIRISRLTKVAREERPDLVSNPVNVPLHPVSSTL